MKFSGLFQHKFHLSQCKTWCPTPPTSFVFRANTRNEITWRYLLVPLCACQLVQFKLTNAKSWASIVLSCISVDKLTHFWIDYMKTFSIMHLLVAVEWWNSLIIQYEGLEFVYIWHKIMNFKFSLTYISMTYINFKFSFLIRVRDVSDIQTLAFGRSYCKYSTYRVTFNCVTPTLRLCNTKELLKLAYRILIASATTYRF